MFKHEGDSIYLDGLKIPLRIFLRLEPEYKSPAGIVVMFYDGIRRNYRTKNNSWTITGTWQDGDRYLSRVDEYKRLINGVNADEFALNEEVANAVKDVIAASESTEKDKYPVEEQPNVELQQRDDIKPKRVKRVRSTSKRSPRTGN